MKPFSKNLFSQTPVAFGWLPKETINLDITVCVCVCVYMCVGKHVCAQPEYEWEIAVALFYRTQKRVWAKADQLEKVCTCRQTCSDAAHRPNSPSSQHRKQNTPLSHVPPSYHHSTPSPQLAPQTPPQNILLCQHHLPPPFPSNPADSTQIQTCTSTRFSRTHTHRFTQLSLVGDRIDSMCPAEP